MKSIRIGRTLRRSVGHPGLQVLGVSLLGMAMLFFSGCPGPPAPPPTAHNLNYRMCLSQSGGVPGDPNSTQPTVDGTVAGDLGWTGAFRYVFENGSTAPDAAVQTIQDGTNLYLSFEVNKDPTFDDKDVVVIGLDPAGTAGDFRRIHIFPFAAGTSGSDNNKPPSVVKYWKGNVGAWGVNQALPAGSDVKVSRSSAGPQSKWSVEVKLPMAAFNIPPANYFGLYFSVFKIDKSQVDPMSGDFVYTENRWPADALLSDGGGGGGTPFSDLETGTPTADKWGNATRGSATCNGVYFSASDISTNNGNIISLNQPTFFKVMAHNSSRDAANNPVAANGILATFKIANFGLPSQWSAIQVAGNPTPNPGFNIPINGMQPYSTGGFTPANPGDYNTPQTHHQCILVEMDSTVKDTTFVNRSAWTNMEFQTTASPFKDVVTVGTVGYETPQGQDTIDITLKEYRYNTEREEKWQSDITGASKASDQVYLLRAKPRDNVQLENTVLPPNITIPSIFIDVPSDTVGQDRKFIKVPVKAGDLLSVIVDQSGRETTAGGAPKAATPMAAQSKQATRPPDYKGSPSPSPTASPTTGGNGAGAPTGTLIGSWDGFDKNSFAINGAISLKVPKNADTLFLAIEYPREGNSEKTGFRVQVVETPLKEIYTDLTSMVTRDPTAEDLRLPLGVNLPTWIICGQRKTGRTLTIDGQRFSQRESTGCYGYIVKEIGHKQ